MAYIRTADRRPAERPGLVLELAESISINVLGFIIVGRFVLSWAGGPGDLVLRPDRGALDGP